MEMTLEDRFWPCLLASCSAASFTALGITAIRRHGEWARRNGTYFVCFAAGVLIAASFLHVIPKAGSMTPRAPAYLLGGYIALYLFNRFITAYVCEKTPDAGYAVGLVPLVGIGFHSFLDGVIYSVAFSVDVFTGVLATAGMVLHEFPEGVITYLLLARSGFSDRRAAQLAFLAAALSTPLGTLVSYPVVSRIDRPLLGSLLAVSAGALVYVGATHLLPQAEREPRKYSLVALAGGVAVAIGIALSEG
jgi:ZIP family zinc transporter